jgi:tetratricopeptide (TPR) repeat protein
MSRGKNPLKGAQKRNAPVREVRRALPLPAGRKRNAVLCVLLAAATIALYVSVARYSFVQWDDSEYVVNNPYVQRGLTWSTIKWAFTSTRAANWHPLTWLSHALDVQLFALNPAGHHLHNILLHALNAVLLFLLLLWMTRRKGPSLLVAALFAAHPLNVESVAWVAERKNVLSTLFFLLAIAAYAWYAQRPQWRRYVPVAVLFALGLMAKPMVITLPFVLLLLDYWPLGRMRGGAAANLPGAGNHFPFLTRARWNSLARLAVEKVPLLALSTASAYLTLLAQHAGYAVRSFEEFPFRVRLENAPVAYCMYLWKMLWPARLAALYPHPGDTLPIWQVILSVAVLAGITLLVVRYRSRGYLPVGWFWFLGTLAPVIGLVQVGFAAVADRYAYVPLIGVFLMVAYGLDDWAEARQIRVVWRTVPAVCVLAALSAVTLRQKTFWESEYALWAHAVAVTDPAHSSLAHNSLARALLHPEVAMTPRDVKDLGPANQRMDNVREQLEETLKVQRQAGSKNPDDLHALVTALNDLGTLDGAQRRRGEARDHLQEAEQVSRQLAQQSPERYRPDLFLSLYNLGNLDLRENRRDDARRHYEEALEIQSQPQQNPKEYLWARAMTLNNLGKLDLEENRLDDARRHCEEALQAYRQLAQKEPGTYLPDLATTLYNLGYVDQQQKRRDESRQNLEEALKIYRQLAQKNPRAYLGDLQDTASLLGTLGGSGTTSKSPGGTARRP